MNLLENREKKISCSFQLREGNSFWSPSWVCFRAIIIQYFFMRFICAFKKYRFASYADDNASYTEYDSIDQQKQPSRGVPRKRCSENMQQIYRRTTMPKCDFNKVAKQLY